MSKQKRQQMVPSKLICPDCGAIFVIQRRMGEQRKLGHTKHLYCFICKETRGFLEIQDRDESIIFWEEYHQSFDEEFPIFFLCRHKRICGAGSGLHYLDSPSAIDRRVSSYGPTYYYPGTEWKTPGISLESTCWTILFFPEKKWLSS